MNKKGRLTPIVFACLHLLQGCMFFKKPAASTPSQEPIAQQKIGRNGTVHIAVFGDSLAAGLFADTQAGKAISNAEAADLRDKFLNVAIDLHGIEDEVIKFRVVDGVFARGELAPFSGEMPYAFPARIEKKLNVKVTKKNYAVSATRTSTMGEQIDAMQIGYQLRSLTPDKKADLVVVHVGGNDWCDARPNADFERDLTTNLVRILNLNPTARVLVLPVSDLVAVLRVPDTVAFTSKLPGLGKRMCTEMRKSPKACAHRDILMGAPEDKLVEHRRSHREYNQIVQKVVESVVKKVNEDSRTKTKFTGKIAVATEYGEPFMKGHTFEEFKADWLAIDCFHPNQKGEEIIAELAWKGMERLLDLP